MSITISDPVILAQIRAVHGTVDILDPQGQLVATLESKSAYQLPLNVKSPFTLEEIEQRRAQYSNGKSLSVVMKRILER